MQKDASQIVCLDPIQLQQNPDKPDKICAPIFAKHHYFSVPSEIAY